MLLDKKSRCFFGLMFCFLAFLVLSACNTMEGAGEDIQDAGKSIEDAGAD